jgi:ComF family protein
VLRSSGIGILDSLSSVILPADCRVCGLPLAGFTLLPVCDSCWNHLPAQAGPLCAQCGEALDFDPLSGARSTCRPCGAVPPDFDKAVAHGVYDDTLRTLLHLLKYDGIEGLAKRLGALLADEVLAIANLPAEIVVVPVPLHKKKRKTRGFNQAELLARGVMAAVRRRRPEMQIKLAGALLRRQRATESQAGLTPHERRENVRGAFFVPRPDAIEGKHVLLIDDIYTTGATARACSKALRSAGAATVWVATVARAQKNRVSLPENAEARGPEQQELPMEEDFVLWEENSTAPMSGARH